MKQSKISVCILLTFLSYFLNAQKLTEQEKSELAFNVVLALKDTLNHLSEKSDNTYFKLHCSSIIQVIDSKGSLTHQDTLFLTDFYNNLNNSGIAGNAKLLTSYTQRQRPFVLAWESPTDGGTSFSWLKVPTDWDPELEYPLYIELHGLWGVADNPINYLTYPYLSGASSSFAFEDGYLLSPWGRGNLWYQGISETDIWECIASLKAITHIDPHRVYLCGHSMGGYGAWSIGSKWPETWAALGIHAGALQYNGGSLVNSTIANQLKNVPTYFVVGTQDGLLSIDQTAYQLLQDAGNANIEFVTFVGGHDYIQENVENMYLWMRNFTNGDLNGTDNSPLSEKNDLIVFPNPLTYNTQINYNLNSSGLVRIEIVNQYGQVVQLLINEFQYPGKYKFIWTPEKNLPAGLYFICLSKEEKVETQLLLFRRE